MNTSTTLLEFAWESLTVQQKYRIHVKYELKKRLEVNTGKKRHVYQAIANEFGYEMRTIEKFANRKKKKI